MSSYFYIIIRIKHKSRVLFVKHGYFMYICKNINYNKYVQESP